MHLGQPKLQTEGLPRDEEGWSVAVDLPVLRINPMESRRWRQEGVFKGQSGKDCISYFEMKALGYKNQNNMVSVGPSFRRTVDRCPCRRKLVVASVQSYGSSMLLSAWMPSSSASQLQLRIYLFKI